MWKQRPFVLPTGLPDLDMKALEDSLLWLCPAGSLPVKFLLLSVVMRQLPSSHSYPLTKKDTNTCEITPPWWWLLMTNRNFTNTSVIHNIFYSLLTFKKLLHFLRSVYVPLPLPSLSPVVSAHLPIYLTVPGIALHKRRLCFPFAWSLL